MKTTALFHAPLFVNILSSLPWGWMTRRFCSRMEFNELIRERGVRSETFATNIYVMRLYSILVSQELHLKTEDSINLFDEKMDFINVNSRPGFRKPHLSVIRAAIVCCWVVFWEGLIGCFFQTKRQPSRLPCVSVSQLDPYLNLIGFDQYVTRRQTPRC